ncbi:MULTISPECIES: glycerol-3-phosphate dehydrogenase subunit GlpB [unclassified Butyricimonas]|uniref:glycerol-3-phosphate dehydrogenase subunit GlpB n=1 Tax=unclassified Butyricimonas TaxID=2637652 RepID=UPI000B36760B|nr:MULTISPECIES: glycerol-3-phosphate dehydrogenase subunit GlpB [unclassified Butyricimonas]OUN64221.1 anaerobic glycerol-3-phosphate dehydrogenase subunit B [Butyricimonas sp. An62]
MKFDTIIIGGGLSGLISGIYLSQRGQRCVIISSGQSALHFSSGSFDLLNNLPDGTSVQKPLDAISELVKQAPTHPYAKLGETKFKELAQQAEEFFKNAGISTQGDHEENHYRVTPMGTLKPTWLTLKNLLISENEKCLPIQHPGIFNITGFLDFYTRFIADEFLKMGAKCSIHSINFPALENLRKNPTEMRSVNIARVFDKQENIKELARILKAESGNCDSIILPAITGLNREDVVDYLRKEINKPIYLLPTLPPSVPGIHTQQKLRSVFQQNGGVFMLGDNVLRADIKGNRISQIYSFNHGDIPFVGQNFILATGSYFSQGLIASTEKIYEPIFDLDVTFTPNRTQWYNSDVFDTQPYQSFGIKTDSTFRCTREGKIFENLYAAGAILEGFNPLKEGCGAGVSILSAMYIAEQILSK